MPEQPDNCEPTEADIDMVIEETTGKPVKPANVAAGVTSMLLRIAELEDQRARLEDHRKASSDTMHVAKYTKHIADVDTDLTIARKRLFDYQGQFGKQN